MKPIQKKPLSIEGATMTTKQKRAEQNWTNERVDEEIEKYNSVTTSKYSLVAVEGVVTAAAAATQTAIVDTE